MKFAEPHGVAHLATTFRFYELLSVIYLQVPLRRPPPFLPLLTPSRTLLNKLGVKKCAHFKRFNRFAAARFDLCRQGRRRREPFMRLPLWSRQLLNGSTVGAAALGGS